MSGNLRVYAIDGIVPVVDPTAFVHPSAVLIGDVIVGPGCYVGPCASLRGDFGRLILEAGANLQDTCVMHGFPGTDTVVEADGHIGHGAVLHGCRIGRNALVGMNAVVMDNAVIGEASIVAASSFVKAGAEIPARVLVAGVPAKIVRELSAEEIRWKTQGTACYQDLTRRCLATLEEVAPLSAVEPDRARIQLQISDMVPLVDLKKNS
ncbi:MAG: phenylacetic acid degradation protein PaaY [Betaproteobacteria bacterium]|nr:phenylacetic acid degradation protein PaaY [Betaproteobacteria bacterium]